MRGITRRLAALAVVLATVLLSAGGLVEAYASGTYGSGAYGSCNYGQICSITLSSSGTVGVNVTPAASSKCTIASDSVSVLTDDTNGYTLTLANSSTNTNLISGANTIAATSGTFAVPIALSGSAWGYRVDSIGSFGAGPTTAQNNISPPSLTFAKVVSSSGTADTLANTNVAANPAVITKVWYGVCANTSVVSGTYSTSVTYTALAN